ncbi:MAG TPA: exodeoxyribonuclease VII small subunit [Candidatus Eisenbacteria bacterium]|nr:exodeoxyribonuclease VII small subunit [Candidatus Eisenbacteria bacterium]
MKKSSAGASTGAAPEPNQTFEAMMERLEALVEKLEEGNLSLQESIDSFEEGMKLVKRCSTVLQEAELRIQKLTRDAEETPASPPASRGKRDEDDGGDELPF